MKFDNKISIGHLISVVVLIVGGIFAYASLTTEQGAQARRLSQVETRAEDHSARLRAIENAQAAQSSDLRNIQAGIVRIEAQLERMAQGGRQ